MTIRYDVIELKATRDDDGFIHDTPVVTRSGVFDYWENGKLIREFRPPEEVFKADSLASMKGKPVTDGHIGMIRAGNKNVIGTILSAGRKDNDNVIADVVIHDPSPIDNGKKELSMGYICKTIDQTGEFNGEKYDRIQTDINYNHIAIVEKGRAGTARFNLDAADIFNNKEDHIVELKEAIETIAMQKAEIATLKQDGEKVKAERDNYKSKLDALDDKAIEKIKADAVTEALAKQELITLAKSMKLDVANNVDITGIKTAVIKYVRGDSVDLSGKDGSYIDAMFDLVRQDEQTAQQNLDKQRNDSGEPSVKMDGYTPLDEL